MATLLLLTNDMRSSAEILPALVSPPHHVAQLEATALLDAPAADVILLGFDGPWWARPSCRLIETTGKEALLLVIAHEKAGWPHCRPTGASTTCCSRPPGRPRWTYGSGWP